MDDTPPTRPHPQSFSATADLERTNRAIEEVIEKRNVFHPDVYAQVLVALYEQRRRLLANDPKNHTSENSNQDDEIRLVTVMFIDIVDSTKIAEQIDFENWRMLIGEVHRRFAETINLWGGEVGQYLGDGLMCFFGARRSRGNDAARAVSCALALQERSAEYYFQVQEQYKIDSFFVRIGISTGRVVVGTIGTEEKSETLAMGSTTNLAARLQSICPPGGVVVDSETHLRARGDFLFTEQPPATLKGFTEPTPYFIVRGQQVQTTDQLTSTSIGNIAIPFVGREKIYERTLTRMRSLQDTHARFAVIFYGDIGIGKSRLLQEVAMSATASQFYTLRMVGHYEQRQLPFSLLRDMLTAVCDLSDALTVRAMEERITLHTTENWDSPMAEAAAAVIGYLTGYGFTDSPYVQSLNRGVSATDEATRRFEWIRSWIRGLAGERPVLLLLDNLQWADPVSLQVLQYLNEWEENILILGAARPEFREEAKQFLEEIEHESIHLAPLSEKNTANIVAAVLEYVENVPEDLVKLILERAEGNPLFVEEFLRMLFDNGVFKPGEDDESWRVDTIQYHMMEDHLPNGLLGVFQARLDDLPPNERRIVQIAAVVGQTFWEGAVSSVAGMDTANRLDNLVARRIIIEKPESRFDTSREYVFRNSLYHDVAYTMLPRAYRVSYHQQVARWLAGLVGTHPESLKLLAEHYTKAEKPLEAVKSYTKAAEYQFRQRHLAETLNLIENGLKVGGKLSREEAIPYASHLWLMKGRVAYARRRYFEATADSQTALTLMRELPNDQMVGERVRAAVTLGNAHSSIGNYAEALDALTDAYQLVDDLRDLIEQAGVLRAFGRLFWARGKLNEAMLYQNRALLSAEESGDLRTMASTNAMLGRILFDQGQMSEALRTFERTRMINRQIDHPIHLISDLRHISTIYRHLFAYEQAKVALDEAIELSESLGYKSPLLEMSSGLLKIDMGDPVMGLNMLRAAKNNEYFNTHDRYNVELSLLKGLAQAGEAQECVEMGTKYIDNVQQHTPVFYGRALLWLGLAKLQLGMPDAAQTLRWALDNERTYGGRDVWMCQYALSIATDDTELAREFKEAAYESLSDRTTGLARWDGLVEIASSREAADEVFRHWQPAAM